VSPQAPIDPGPARPQHHPGTPAATSAAPFGPCAPDADCRSPGTADGPTTTGTPHPPPSWPPPHPPEAPATGAGTSNPRHIGVDPPLLHHSSEQPPPSSGLPLPTVPPAARVLWSQVAAQSIDDLLAAHNQRNDADTQHAARALLELQRLLLVDTGASRGRGRRTRARHERLLAGQLSQATCTAPRRTDRRTDAQRQAASMHRRLTLGTISRAARDGNLYSDLYSVIRICIAVSSLAFSDLRCKLEPRLILEPFCDCPQYIRKLTRHDPPSPPQLSAI
jgi:hypothetical protein